MSKIKYAEMKLTKRAEKLLKTLHSTEKGVLKAADMKQDGRSCRPLEFNQLVKTERTKNGVRVTAVRITQRGRNYITNMFAASTGV